MGRKGIAGLLAPAQHGLLRRVDPDNFRRDRERYRRAADAVAL